MTRVLSCIQPSGDVHLGNYLGALVELGQRASTSATRSTASSISTPSRASRRRASVGAQTLELAATLFAIGLDPDVATVFVQSHVPEHTQLGWIMECIVSFGELSRMTQFKDKAAKREGEFIPAGLFTYPALQAADILLYDADEVPVGEDQRQHVEITRDIAIRFNHRYGETFVVPRSVHPKAGARVMDLQDPTSKMSKSADSDAGLVYLFDDPSITMKKFKRAVTDSDNEVRYDRDGQARRVEPARHPRRRHRTRPAEAIAADYTQYGRAEGRHRRGGRRGAAADPGPVRRADRRSRRAGPAATDGGREGPERRRPDSGTRACADRAAATARVTRPARSAWRRGRDVPGRRRTAAARRSARTAASSTPSATTSRARWWPSRTIDSTIARSVGS